MGNVKIIMICQYNLMPPITPDLAEAHLILANVAEYNAQQIQAALLLIATNAEYRLIGICATTISEATQALQGYLMAFGYAQPPIPEESITAPGVFLKFNPVSNTCLITPYAGSERGVIVSCFSPASEGNNETYGNLPLDLFNRSKA